MSNLAKKTQKILPVNRVLSTSLMCFLAWHSSLYFKTFMSNRFVGKHLYFLVGHIRHFLLLFQPTFYTLFLTIWQLTPYALVKKKSLLQSLKNALCLTSRVFLLPHMPLTFPPPGKFLRIFKAQFRGVLTVDILLSIPKHGYLLQFLFRKVTFLWLFNSLRLFYCNELFMYLSHYLLNSSGL